jgi:tetratricopeptide (TPR) repeat protein
MGAVRLFVERVRNVKPEFALSESNAPTVVDIVRALDGLPLALELVAARARVLSPTALLARLDRSLPLLTGGAQDLPDRQRTLRDTIAWSYNLLRPDEQALFRRLGVFAGGCTLEGAESVAGDGSPVAGTDHATGSVDPGPLPPATIDVLAGLASLVDSSLLQSEEQGDEPRYTMLATIREFALERLRESGEAPAIHERHAYHFLDLAERTATEVFRTAPPALLDVLEREHDNLRAALAWSQESSDGDALLRLSGALGFFWFYRGYLNEGRRWLDVALDTPPDTSSPRPRAWALTASGLLLNVCGETDRAAALLKESFPWWEQTTDARLGAFARSMLGGVFVSQGRYDEALPLFAANEPYFRTSGYDDALAHALFHLGAIAWTQGDDARARDLLRESAERFERFGAPTDASDPLRYLGLLACAAGDLGDAVLWFRAELKLLRQRGSRAALAVGLADVATLAAAREAWQAAARLFAKAEALLDAEAAAFSLPARDHYERAYQRAREALGTADLAVTSAGRGLSLEDALAEAEEVLGRDDDEDLGATAENGGIIA